MHENKASTCPLCGQNFSTENGETPEEHIAKGIIKAYCELQDASLLHKLPCPRCGRMNMQDELSENALSRCADIYICTECGADEAICEAKDNISEAKSNILPLTAWYITNEILKSISGVRCADYIPEKNNPYPLCDNTECKESKKCNISAHMENEGGYCN